MIVATPEALVDVCMGEGRGEEEGGGEGDR